MLKKWREGGECFPSFQKCVTFSDFLSSAVCYWIFQKLSIFVRVLKLDCNAHKYWFHSFFCLQVFWARETRQPRETMDFLIKSRPCAGRVKTLLSLGVTLYALLFLGLGPGPHVSTCWLFPIILKVTVGAIQPKVQCRGFNFWHYLSACFSCLCYEPI